MKIRISADSTCDLTSALTEQYDVKIVPLYILMDDKALRDGIECTRDDIFAYTSRTGKLCGTAAVSIADYLDFFGEELRTHDQVVHFTISSDMSACFQNACDAAQEFPGRVFVVDSRNLSTGIGHLVIDGALLAREKYGADIILTGRTADILRELEKAGCKEVPQGIEIANAEEVVEICDDPATAFKQKKDSSLTVGLNLLRDGQADGFISAGSTGALLAGATLVVKRIRGLRRAALAPTIPTMTGKAVLIDCGANAECTSEYLLQFAYLGSYYAEKVLGIVQPHVGLLNIGAEPSKGDALRHETYARLKEAGGQGHLNFIGNIEANTALAGGCDVIVADGYSGNIMLKSVEGAAKLMSGELKKMLTKSAKTKLAYLLLKDGLADFKKMLDPNEVGGTALLGISRPVIKAHGSSNAAAFCNAVRQTIAVAESGIIADITQNVDKMKVTPEKD